MRRRVVSTSGSSGTRSVENGRGVRDRQRRTERLRASDARASSPATPGRARRLGSVDCKDMTVAGRDRDRAAGNAVHARRRQIGAESRVAPADDRAGAGADRAADLRPSEIADAVPAVPSTDGGGVVSP